MDSRVHTSYSSLAMIAVPPSLLGTTALTCCPVPGYSSIREQCLDQVYVGSITRTSTLLVDKYSRHSC